MILDPTITRFILWYFLKTMLMESKKIENEMAGSKIVDFEV